MKLENKNILYFSPLSWNDNWQRQQEFAVHMAKKNKVLFVSPIGMINYNFLGLLRRIFVTLKIRRGKQQEVRNTVPENIIRVNFFFLPRHNNIFFESLNRKLLLFQIRRKLRSCDMTNDLIFWTGNPSRTISQLAEYLKPQAFVYDNAMRFEKLPGVPEYILEHEKIAVRKSNFSITDNDFKKKQFESWGARVYKIPQAVDLKVFDVTKKYDVPKALEAIPHPIAGYYGAMHSVLDYDLLFDVARNLKDVHFVLLGAMHDASLLSRLLKLKNVHYLPPVPHSELPSYLAHFDVCLIPYVVNDYTKGTFPNKLFEYFSFNKAVVAEPLPEFEAYKEFMYLAGGREQFSQAIRKALVSGPQNTAQLQQLVSENDWSARFRALDDAFEKVATERKIRVAMISPDLEKVGPNHVILNIAKNVQKEKFDVTFVALAKKGWGKYLKNAKDITPEFDEANIPIVNLKIPKGFDIFFAIPKLIFALQKLKPDVVHSSLMRPNLVARIACGMLGIPNISSLHNEDHWVTSRSTIDRIIHSLDRFTFRYVDVFVAVASNVKAYVLQHEPRLKEADIRVINNAVDTKKFVFDSGIRTKKRAELGFQEGEVVIGTVGRLDYQKDPGTFVDMAMKVLGSESNVRFVWIGEGPMQDEVRAYAKQLGIEDSILFLGQRNDVRELLLAFDVFVLTSRFEGLPMSLLEAMASRLPCVATGVSGNKVVIQDGKNGFLAEVSNSGQVAVAVKRLVKSPKLREDISKQAESDVQKDYALAKFVAAYESLYTQYAKKD